MKKTISAILCAVILMLTVCCGFSAVAAESSGELKFNEDGSFKILQVSDLQDNYILNPVAKEMLRATLKRENPDLVILTGDNISGGSCRSGTKAVDMSNCRRAIGQFMSIFEDYGVKVAAVFGNHDNENQVTKEELMSMYCEYDCFVGGDFNPELYGCGTYNLPIYASDGSGETKYNLWLFDSNTYDAELGGYDYVHDDQVDWYINKSNELKAANGGKAVPSMAFQHIIVKEVFEALNASGVPSDDCHLVYDGMYYTIKPENYKAGLLKEYPCPGTRDGRQFSAMVEQGDVTAMFFGHDHNNTFELTYSGIDLVATPGFTFNSYGNEDRGVRVININENDASTYETYLLHWQDMYGDSKLAAYHYNMYASDLGFWENLKAGLVYILLFPIKLIFGYVF